MSRWLIQAASMAAMAACCGWSPLSAQTTPSELPVINANSIHSTLPMPIPPRAKGIAAEPKPIPSQPAVQETAPSIPHVAPAPHAAAKGTIVAGTAAAGPVVAGAGVLQQAGYVRLGAPMYPSPRPNVPAWTGGTMITNQALAPHEMLYPHTYRAMYPPFYHRVKGSYFWTPFGTRSREKWELQGTLVQVKYRSAWPIFGPHKPVISEWGGPWY